MKKIILFCCLLSVIGCQREKMNEVGVGYNKSLIIPPTNDLPAPGSTNSNQSEDLVESQNPLVNSILEQTQSNQTNNGIIDKIDDQSGFKSDKGFFNWLFNDKDQE